MLLPEALLVFIVDRSQEIVKVHNDVHEGVDESHEDRVPAAEVFDAEKGQGNHTCVVIDVQERHMVLLLLQHEEHRVQKVNDFGQEIQVAHLGDLHGVIIVRVIDGLAGETVALAVGMVITHDGDVRADHYLQQIVVLDDRVELHWLPVLHEFGPPHQDEVQVGRDDRHRLEWIRHQEHVAHTSI